MKSEIAKDACAMFNVSAKHLSKIMLGKKYAGGQRKANTKTPGLKGPKGGVNP